MSAKVKHDLIACAQVFSEQEGNSTTLSVGVGVKFPMPVALCISSTVFYSQITKTVFLKVRTVIFNFPIQM